MEQACQSHDASTVFYSQRNVEQTWLRSGSSGSRALPTWWSPPVVSRALSSSGSVPGHGVWLRPDMRSQEPGFRRPVRELGQGFCRLHKNRTDSCGCDFIELIVCFLTECCVCVCVSARLRVSLCVFALFHYCSSLASDLRLPVLASSVALNSELPDCFAADVFLSLASCPRP